MNGQPELSGQTAGWKALVSCLPGVMNAEFVLEGGAIREVHVLADQSRNPKQIVRDIQSAMAARFQIEVDHRVVSIAQIPGAPGGSPMQARRLICDHLALSTGRSGTGITVLLNLDGRQEKSEISCGPSGSERMRAIATATVDAINRFLIPGFHFTLSEIKRTAMGERSVLLVSLQLKNGSRPEGLLGACFEGEDPNLSVVLATLDAVNRRILSLHFTAPE